MPTLLLDDKQTLEFKFHELNLFVTGAFLGLTRGYNKDLNDIYCLNIIII